MGDSNDGAQNLMVYGAVILAVLILIMVLAVS